MIFAFKRLQLYSNVEDLITTPILYELDQQSIWLSYYGDETLYV